MAVMKLIILIKTNNLKHILTGLINKETVGIKINAKLLVIQSN